MDDISENCHNLETFELYAEHMTLFENISIQDPEALDEEITNKFQKLSSIAIAFKRGEASEDFGIQSYCLVKYLIAKCASQEICVGLEKNPFLDLFIFKTTNNRSFSQRYHDISSVSDESSEAEESAEESLKDDANSEWTSYCSESDSKSDIGSSDED